MQQDMSETHMPWDSRLMCALRKPYIRSLNWYGFKTHYYSAIDMIIKTKQMVFGRVPELRDVKVQSYSGKGGGGGGGAAHLHLKRHAPKQCVSASAQNRYFQNDIINDLWGILSWNFTGTFWGHLRLILHLVKRGIKKVPFKITNSIKHKFI